VTVGYGPRFLHSTGQLHKGGTDRCRFLQIVDQPTEDLAVPETSYTFGTLIGAQAEGDRQALEQRKRTVLRIQLGADDAEGLAALRRAVEGAP
jgi:transaldolase/glucose-6-phosphate isomerase